AAGNQQVEQRCLRSTLRSQGVGFCVAEEAGEKALGKKEQDGDTDGEADVSLRDGIAETGQHEDEKSHDDATAVVIGELEGEDEGSRERRRRRRGRGGKKWGKGKEGMRGRRKAARGSIEGGGGGGMGTERGNETALNGRAGAMERKKESQKRKSKRLNSEQKQ